MINHKEVTKMPNGVFRAIIQMLKIIVRNAKDKDEILKALDEIQSQIPR